VTIVEVGVWQGGSLQMWKHYFGPKARIYGIDINQDCAMFAEPQIEILIGSQEDRQFLRWVRESVPVIDILIDDGGHRMQQQIVTFEELFPHISADGVYLCEDLHTSYWEDHDGGYRKPGTFIEYSKNFIDKLNAWHARKPRRRRTWYGRRLPRLRLSPFTSSTHSLHYYDSVLVIEKRRREAPSTLRTGAES
jgi:hypothetical protein